MRVRVGPAKRDGADRVIFDQELSRSEVCAEPETGIAISITAEPVHKKSRYHDNSSYRYQIVLSAAEVLELAKRVIAAQQVPEPYQSQHFLLAVLDPARHPAPTSGEELPDGRERFIRQLENAARRVEVTAPAEAPACLRHL